MSASSISFTGFIRSMMEIGFTLWQCMNEKLENSDSANAANMKITLQDGKLIIADDGKGMNEDEMKTCGRFHNRSTSSAIKHGTKGVGGNIADINLSGRGRVMYCSKSASSQRITSMELNYGVDTEEEYRPRPQEAPARVERDIWDKYSLDRTRSGTVQLYETVPPKIYKQLVESIKANDIVQSFRRIWAFTYESILRSGKTIVFDVEGEEYTIHPIDMMKYNETDESNRHIDHCSIWKKTIDAQNEETRVYYTNSKGKLCYRDYSNSKKGNETAQARPEQYGFTKIGDFMIMHTHNQNWRELHKEEMAQNEINVEHCSDQNFLNHIGGGVLTIARNRKHVCSFPTCQTGESASYIPYHQNSKHLLDYDANDTMDGLFNIQLNKSSLVRDNIQKEVIQTIDHLNRKFIGKMKTITEKQEQETAAAAAAVAVVAPAAVVVVAPVVDSEEESSSDASSSASAGAAAADDEPHFVVDVAVEQSLGGGDRVGNHHQHESEYNNDESVNGVVAGPVPVPVMALPQSRVSIVSQHTRETIPQNHGIQIVQQLKQQPQYHDAMNDMIETILVDCCHRISDERIARAQTKRLINIGSFENKCDLLVELLQGIYVLPEDTMRHGAALHRKYNAVVNELPEA